MHFKLIHAVTVNMFSEVHKHAKYNSVLLLCGIINQLIVHKCFAHHLQKKIVVQCFDMFSSCTFCDLVFSFPSIYLKN